MGLQHTVLFGKVLTLSFAPTVQQGRGGRSKLAENGQATGSTIQGAAATAAAAATAVSPADPLLPRPPPHQDPRSPSSSGSEVVINPNAAAGHVQVAPIELFIKENVSKTVRSVEVLPGGNLLVNGGPVKILNINMSLAENELHFESRCGHEAICGLSEEAKMHLKADSQPAFVATMMEIEDQHTRLLERLVGDGFVTEEQIAEIAQEEKLFDIPFLARSLAALPATEVQPQVPDPAGPSTATSSWQ